MRLTSSVRRMGRHVTIHPVFKIFDKIILSIHKPHKKEKIYKKTTKFFSFPISVYALAQKYQLLLVSHDRINANQDGGVLCEEFCMSAKLPSVHWVAVCARALAPYADVPLIAKAMVERIRLTCFTLLLRHFMHNGNKNSGKRPKKTKIYLKAVKMLLQWLTKWLIRVTVNVLALWQFVYC